MNKQYCIWCISEKHLVIKVAEQNKKCQLVLYISSKCSMTVITTVKYIYPLYVTDVENNQGCKLKGTVGFTLKFC